MERSICRNVIVLTSFGLVSTITHTYSQHKPNLILIIVDDVSWNDIGYFGNKVAQTPNIDKLASKGMRFNNAYITTSSSSPSRASIITGKYSHSTGAAELQTPLPKHQIPFTQLLKESGYFTGQAGKWHLGPNIYNAFDIHTDKNEYDHGDGGEDNWIPFLKNRPKDKPFFFWFASYDAHRPWGGDNFHITHDPDKFEVPFYFADTLETRQDIASYYNEIARFDFFIGEVRKELECQGILDNIFIIIISDNGRPFPRCKTRVYDSGMKTPFVVSCPNGIKDKGAVTESLISAIDIAPTILEIAGIKIPEEYQGKSFIAILKKSTHEIRNVIFSEHNWHDYEAHERMVRTKDFLYVFNSRPNLTNCGPADSKISPTQHALNKIRDEGKLTPAQSDVFVTPRSNEELFDVNKNPEQLINIASLSEYQNVLNEMRALLRNWQNNTGDTTPVKLTPDWYERETGTPLKINSYRGVMPGYQQ